MDRGPVMSAVHMVQKSACACRVAPSNGTSGIPCSCMALFATDSLPHSSLLAGEALSRVGRPVGNLTLRPPCRPRGCLRSPQRLGCAPCDERAQVGYIPKGAERESSSRVYPEKGKEAPEDCREREGWRTSPSLMPGRGDCCLGAEVSPRAGRRHQSGCEVPKGPTDGSRASASPPPERSVRAGISGGPSALTGSGSGPLPRLRPN